MCCTSGLISPTDTATFVDDDDVDLTVLLMVA